MLETRAYGYTCPECRKFHVLGEIEIDSNAQLAELRALLPDRGWLDNVVTCTHCGNTQFCTLRDVTFL
jgi:hypothetical protein